MLPRPALQTAADGMAAHPKIGRKPAVLVRGTRTAFMNFAGCNRDVLPLACAWAEEQEALILRDGVALTPLQIADTCQIGVAHPERVRLRVVEQIPLPLHPMLRDAAEVTGFFTTYRGVWPCAMEFSFSLILGASADWLFTNWRTQPSMSDLVVSKRFLNNTYLNASHCGAMRLVRWNERPSESSVRPVRNHTQRARPRSTGVDEKRFIVEGMKI